MVAAVKCSKRRRAAHDETERGKRVKESQKSTFTTDDAAMELVEASAEAFDIDRIRELVEGLQSEEAKHLSGEALRAARTALKDLEHERARLRLMLQYEHKILDDERARLTRQGCADVDASMKTFAIVGVDEVGVGPLAGPCVGGAVCLWLGNVAPPSTTTPELRSMLDEGNFMLKSLYGVNDSKKLKPIERETLDRRIRTSARAFAVGVCTSQEVDMLNNRNASMEVMRRAVMTLLNGPLAGHRVHLLVDYHTVPDMPDDQVVGQTSLEKGDAKSQSIGAASIIAKVYRDAYMHALHQRFPHFGFDKNAGYGTRDHMNALKRGYLCPEHRISFAPVRAAFERCQDDDGKDEQTMKLLSVHYKAWTVMQAEKLQAAKAEKEAKAAAAAAAAATKPLKQRFEPNGAKDANDDRAAVKPNALMTWLKKKKEA